jgi:hypothetical protein
VQIRKGRVIQQDDMMTERVLTGLSIPVTVNRGGAGGVGINRAVNQDGEVVFTARYGPAFRSIYSGRP